MLKEYTYIYKKDIIKEVSNIVNLKEEFILKIINPFDSSIAIIPFLNGKISILIVNLNSLNDFFNINQDLEQASGLKLVNQKIIDMNDIICNFVDENMLIDFQTDRFILSLKDNIDEKLTFVFSIVFNNLNENVFDQIKNRIKFCAKRIVDINNYIEEFPDHIRKLYFLNEDISKITSINTTSFIARKIPTFKKFCDALNETDLNIIKSFNSLNDEEIKQTYRDIIFGKDEILYSEHGVQISRDHSTLHKINLQLINNIPTSYLNFKLICSILKLFNHEIKGVINV